MKVYFIYMDVSNLQMNKYPGINPEKIFRSGGKEYTLYAFSESKKQIDQFENLRDMNRFKIIIKKMNYNDFEVVRDDDYYREFYLCNRYLTYEVLNKSNEFTSDYVPISITDRELKYVTGVTDEIFKSIISEYDYVLFNSPYSKLIKSSYYNALNYISDFDNTIMKSYDEEDVPWYPKKFNMFALYCNKFKNTYNVELEGDMK